jgi:hypothetical protein
VVALAVVALVGTASAEAAGRRRALLIGIDDYTASRFGARDNRVQQRDWPTLGGSVNDVRAMQEMLVLLYGFDAREIVTLTDQAATRNAILQAVQEHLLRKAAKGDIVFFYYAGHGSQVRNSLSDEVDKLDESIVPADSRAGARDIRDKELRPIFNRILDAGARLTVILDSCHSGSGARGLATGAPPRGVKPDLRDVADGTSAGPRPEDRGALVVAAAQDFDSAWETRDAQGTLHGAFSWAWIRSMRDSSAGEPAMDTFLRAQARLRAETPYQEPVLAGNAQARFSPFLGSRTDRGADRTVVGVERLLSDGTVLLQGGWANGLAVGSELRAVSDRRGDLRLTVIAIRGLGQATARVQSAPGRAAPTIQSGDLFEVIGWAAPPARRLRVWMPRISEGGSAISDLARLLAEKAAARSVRWVSDPLDVTPTHLLRWSGSVWELLDASGGTEVVGPFANAVAALTKLPAGASLFVQFPAPAGLVDGIAVGPGTARHGIDPTMRADEADYILVGRFSGRRLEYSWMRPSVKRSDRRKTGLPLRTSWTLHDSRDSAYRHSAPALRDAVLRLHRIQAWHLLESPPDSRAIYRLALRRARTNQIVTDPVIVGGEQYSLVLRAASKQLPARVPQRYVYAFSIDSEGRSDLLFPRSGSVENRLPLPRSPGDPASYPPMEIPLDSSFEGSEPYGVDTFFLLSTDEPLPNPWILEWEGVGRRAPQPGSALETLLMLIDANDRPALVVTPATWSIERVMFESVAPRTSSRAKQTRQRSK